MRERSILFSAPMVRAILAGHKTQTRRPVAFDVANACTHANGATSPAVLTRCPYGQPGDRLWVREAWRTYKSLDECPPRSIESGAGLSYIADEIESPPGFGRYRHARFIPRWASRITLEVMSVRVERLYEMTATDAMAEGIDCQSLSPVLDFHGVWNAIYAAKGIGWAANPWVWVVEFSQMED